MLHDAIPVLAEALRRRFGLATNTVRTAMVLSAAERVISTHNLSGPEDILSALARGQLDDAVSQDFLSLVTVHESYFFRDATVLHGLRTEVLPLLAARRKESSRLRIWSAGCARGEEAYSLAFMTREIPSLHGFTIEILGTDLDARSVARASRAQYSGASLRDCTPEQLSKYFEPVSPGRHRVKSRYRADVHFAVDNLTDPTLSAAAGPFDLILCRNVAIYFDGLGIEALHKKLARYLAPGGVALLGTLEPRPTRLLEPAPGNSPGLPLYHHARTHQQASRVALSVLPSSDAVFVSDGTSQPSSKPGALSSASDTCAPMLVENILQSIADGSRKIAARRTTETNGTLRVVPSTRPLLRTLSQGVPRAPREERSVENVRSVDAQPAARSPDSEDLFAQAKSLADVGALNESLALAMQHMECNALDPRAYALAGMISQELGAWEQAEMFFRRAAYLDPTHESVSQRIVLLRNARVSRPREALK